MGGDISVTSTPDIGSSFIINLPLEKYENLKESAIIIGRKISGFAHPD